MDEKAVDTYKLVVETLQEINAHRTFATIGTPQREDLDKAVLVLEDLSWRIISDNLAQFVGVISNGTGELRAISDKIGRTYDDLSDISKKIKTTADAVGMLSDAAGKAISAGLL